MPDTTHDGKPLPEPACTECGGNGYHTDEYLGYLEEQREMLRVQLKEMTSARDGLRAEVGRLEERLDDAREALEEQEEEATTATIQRIERLTTALRELEGFAQRNVERARKAFETIDTKIKKDPFKGSVRERAEAIAAKARHHEAVRIYLVVRDRVREALS